MSFEISFGNILAFAGLLVTVLGGFMKLLMMAHEKRIDERFASIHAKFTEIETMRSASRAEWEHRFKNLEGSSHAIERDFLSFKAELPRQYALRDDYMRNQLTLESMLNTLTEKFENLLLRMQRQ